MRWGTPAEVNAPRALLLCAAGAVLGLSIAGYGLFTAHGTTTRTVPPENIATVNQRPLLRSDFITQLESETGKTLEETSRQEQLKVLAEMVQEELLVQRALELDFGETDQNSRNALVAAISDQAIAEVISSQPSEQQLQDFYAAHPDKWSSEGTMSLRHFIVNAASDAQATASAAAIVQQLRAGTRVETLIASKALKEAPPQTDEYYFALEARLGPALFAAVREVPSGGIAAPVALADGIHILQVQSNSTPVRYSFAQAHSQVSSDYNTAAQAKRMQSTLDFLRSRAKILIAEDFAADFKP